MPPLASSRLCRGSLALLTVALCAASVFGQGPEVPSDKGVRRSRIFQMPFSLPTADKARTQQIKLFVKPDQGGDWQLHATAMPDQLRYDPRNRLEIGEFDVRLDRDGAFKFAVMTVFTNGSSEPATVDQLGHDQTMTIVVDTRPPNINLKALPPRAKGDGSTVVGIEWNVEDDNLARNTLRLEGRWWGNVNWTNFFRGTGPEESGRQEWTLRANQRMEVRIVASDRAGNQATKAVVLGNGVANVTGASAAGGNDGGPLLSQPTYRMVSTKTVNLSYRVRGRPPSGLGKNETWGNAPGSDWKKIG